MTDMKCPFCQQELVREGSNNYWCKKCNLERYSPALYGSQKLWQELIRTRKALDVAVDVLKEIDELLSSNKFDVREVPLLNITQTKISMLLKCINIEQITALEQKDVK